MELRNKSLHNIDAASCLMQGQHYTESIHCVYYACYQMLLYKIDELFDKNERERKSDYDAYMYNRSINRGRLLGSHDFWITFFQEKMQENGIAFFMIASLVQSYIQHIDDNIIPEKLISKWENKEINSNPYFKLLMEIKEILTKIIKK